MEIPVGTVKVKFDELHMGAPPVNAAGKPGVYAEVLEVGEAFPIGSLRVGSVVYVDDARGWTTPSLGRLERFYFAEQIIAVVLP